MILLIRRILSFSILLLSCLTGVDHDSCGLAGMAIITGICKSDLDHEKLFVHRSVNCRKSEVEIAKPLKGKNREDCVVGFKQVLESYQFYQEKIAEYSDKIIAFLKQQISYQPPTQYLFFDERRKLGINKRMRIQIDEFELTKNNLGFVTT